MGLCHEGSWKVPLMVLNRGNDEDILGGSKGLIPVDCVREPGEDPLLPLRLGVSAMAAMEIMGRRSAPCSDDFSHSH